MSLKTLQNFYKTTISQPWATGTGNFYVTARGLGGTISWGMSGGNGGNGSSLVAANTEFI